MDINKKKVKSPKGNYRFIYTPIMFGIIIGVLAVLAQPVFRIQPPQAYGICTVCHARDLINWLSIKIFSYEFETVAAVVTLPLTTTVGVFVGSFISSKLNGEFRLVKVENLIKMFFLGILDSSFGLIIISCPTRLFLRLAFGDPFSLLSIAGLLSGISIGVIILKKGV